MTADFIPKLIAPEKLKKPALWFALHDEKILLDKTNTEYFLPYSNDIAKLNVDYLRQHYLGTYKDIDCFALELNHDNAIPEQMYLCPLRQSYEILGNELFNIVGRASQILIWDKTHQFCGRCGTQTYIKNTERAKVCPKCDLHSYPRISPSIIVLIEKGDEILLARSPHFKPGLYSTLAGFIEPGETVEEAVAREIYEEVGLKVKDISYQLSQPWPFPHSLMLGFTAQHASGEIKIDGVEIEDAHWYNIHNLPELPVYASIARWLINNFIDKQLKKK